MDVRDAARRSQQSRTPSGAGVALVLKLYWVVGNPCINMVQSYRLVGPIYRHQLLCHDLEYLEDNTQKLRYQWSPNGEAVSRPNHWVCVLFSGYPKS